MFGRLDNLITFAAALREVVLPKKFINSYLSLFSYKFVLVTTNMIQ